MLDSLAYVEHAFGTQESRAMADALVDDEIIRSGIDTTHWHPSVAPESEFAGSEMVNAELERIGAGEPAPARDATRWDHWQFPSVKDKGADELSRAALERAQVQTELAHFHSINATLDERLAGPVLEGHLALLETQIADMNVRLQDVKTSTDTGKSSGICIVSVRLIVPVVNAKRKRSQLAAAKELYDLELKIEQRTTRCQQLRAAIASGRASLREREADS